MRKRRAGKRIPERVQRDRRTSCVTRREDLTRKPTPSPSFPPFISCTSALVGYRTIQFFPPSLPGEFLPRLAVRNARQPTPFIHPLATLVPPAKAITYAKRRRRKRGKTKRKKKKEKVTSTSGRIDDGGTHVGLRRAPPLSSSEFKLVVLVGEVVKVERGPARDKLSR